MGVYLDYTDIKKTSISEDAEQGMNMTLASKIKPGPHMPTRRHHTSGIPEPPEGDKNTT